MMRILFGLALALIVAVPTLRDMALSAVFSPPVLAFTAGVLAWPRITAAARRWAR